MVSSSFFAASGWRAGLATLEIAVSRQIDVRLPVYTRHSSMIWSHRRRATWFTIAGNSLAISRGCAVSTVPGSRDGIIAGTCAKAIRQPCVSISLIYGICR
jgi:hypothetical protein